ncbi:MAG: type I-MYXAN CRISPR-associated Cas8a1/Cmx1 [Bacteroidales bacterium]|nr:type I-MYXAN CRISPR-associated Cas8a1/Cmx1 [Bacteroidales bacterium]
MAKVAKVSPPDHLTMHLFAPGMSLMHRAGLGGLACTLRAMEAEFPDGNYPWEVQPHAITLRFGKPENARDYLKRLFEFAFRINAEGLITLPGQYEREPSAAVLADLQAGFLLTFLQHGRVRTLAKETIPVSYDPEGDGQPGVIVQYRKCSYFTHQNGWEEFVERTGEMTRKPLPFKGPICPGAVVRHEKFAADTIVKYPPDMVLPLYFALVGSLPLPVNRGVAALLVPEVENLQDFAYDRPSMTPSTARDCQIGNAADAALQAQIRIRSRHAAKSLAVPGCYAMTFQPTTWSKQQKSRVATIHVPPASDRVLDRFERALTNLPNRIVTRTVRESTGRGAQKQVTERQESFRSNSVIRPVVAENLALGRPWYAGFTKLMTKINPATDKPYRDQLPFERKGLHAMISDPKMWDEEGDRLVVEAVHDAIGRRLGQIRAETDGDKPLSQATKNRWERFRERLRLELAGAKTEAHVRFALTDLFSRAGNNVVLREHWAKVLPVIRKDWQLARDLGLLALASYSGRGDTDESDSKTSTNGQ